MTSLIPLQEGFFLETTRLISSLIIKNMTIVQTYFVVILYKFDNSSMYSSQVTNYVTIRFDKIENIAELERDLSLRTYSMFRDYAL